MCCQTNIAVHILEEADKAGITNVVVTGSMVTFPPGKYGPNGEPPAEILFCSVL
jgi:hypothetical protein